MIDRIALIIISLSAVVFFGWGIIEVLLTGSTHEVIVDVALGFGIMTGFVGLIRAIRN